MAKLQRILGLDPGSVITGYGIIETDGVRDFYLTHGHFKVVGDTFPEKLGFIHRELSALLAQWKPESAGVEQVFLSKNPMSALKLGQARGAAISAIVTQGIPVFEYSPRHVKQAVTGTGAADKNQVQTMVKTLLSIKSVVQADAADGLAIALCHSHMRGTPLPKRRTSRGRSLRL